MEWGENPREWVTVKSGNCRTLSELVRYMPKNCLSRQSPGEGFVIYITVVCYPLFVVQTAFFRVNEWFPNYGCSRCQLGDVDKVGKKTLSRFAALDTRVCAYDKQRHVFIISLGSVVTWFSCFNAVITSDKFVYLFGRIIPALSLILSMSLRLVPRFKAQIKVISDAQKCIGRDVSNGTVFRRARHGIKILSIMVTWALENAIETADSMKGRDYKRTALQVLSDYKRRNDLGVFHQPVRGLFCAVRHTVCIKYKGGF